MGSAQVDVAGVVLDPLDQGIHGQVQSQDQNEDQHEADDGVSQVGLGLLTVLRLFSLGKLHAQQHAVQAAQSGNDGQSGAHQAVDQSNNGRCNAVQVGALGVSGAGQNGGGHGGNGDRLGDHLLVDLVKQLLHHFFLQNFFFV